MELAAWLCYFHFNLGGRNKSKKQGAVRATHLLIIENIPYLSNEPSVVAVIFERHGDKPKQILSTGSSHVVPP